FETHFLSSLLFWSVVSFGILMVLLNKYALPAIMEMLDQREKKIKDNLADADRLKKEAQDLLSQYEGKLKAVHQEGQEILENARKQAQEQLEDNEKRVKQDTDRMLADAKSEISRDKQKALQDVQKAAVELSLLAAEKILARNLSDADHKRLVDEALQEISERFN
ncbi:MAG TPA: F0F1 ATP synthase subunit B, partial [Nitrospiria bacterium]